MTLLPMAATAPKRLARVFPRRTKATPDDALTFVGMPSLADLAIETDEVHVSVAFTWDKSPAERIAERWSAAGHLVRVGGVAYGDRGDDFIAGRYIKPGYVFTSRGCPRTCKFCSVPLRDPKPRLLPIQDGWNILDDNLLATPRAHVEAVFNMLRRVSRERLTEYDVDRVEFTGGLEARSLKDYHVDLLASLTPRPNMFWAYDPGDTFEVMESAARRLLAAGFTRESHRMRCYVLIGYSADVSEDGCADTPERAEVRLREMVGLGFTPMAMLYRPEGDGRDGWQPEPVWRALQRRWARPAIIHAVEAVA